MYYEATLPIRPLSASAHRFYCFPSPTKTVFGYSKSRYKPSDVVQGYHLAQYKLIIKIKMEVLSQGGRRDAQFRVKTLNKSQKCIEPHALEVIACSSLCELSENICREDVTGRTANSRQLAPTSTKHHDYSPWKLKKEGITLDAEIRLRKKTKAKLQVHSTKDSSYAEGKENNSYGRAYRREEAETQKYPSIFMRLRAAKDTKTDTGKKERSETEIVTIMKRKKTNKDQLQSRKVILIQEIQERTHNVRAFNKKIEDLEIIKKYSLNSIKPLPNCLLQLQPENSQKQNAPNKAVKTVIDHWKSRRLSVKGKKQKTSQQSRETKSIERRQNKENILMSKKASFSMEKAYRDEYQSSNPLTRLLYEKYINTISIHQPRQQHFHYL